MQNTRGMIGDFQRAFKRPIHDTLQTKLSPEDRLLLGSILIEEAIETVTKGLGLKVMVNIDGCDSPDSFNNLMVSSVDEDNLYLEVDNHANYDPIETADGLGDINVVIHFNAHWLGMNLDRITQEINDSNMSKLDEKGRPIINGVTEGYRDKACLAENNIGEGWADDEEGFRADLPIGKILKGPNFRKPDIAGVLGLSHGLHIDEPDIKPSAQLEHCSEHPDQTTANCEGGFGLAGGGYGAYSICGKCGNVFGKTDDGDDFG